MRLPFTVAPAGDVFQHKIDKILKELPNVFGTANDILIMVRMLMAKIITEH